MNKQTRALVLGGDGMAGHMVKTFLEETGYDVFTTTRGEDTDKNRTYDVMNHYGALEKIIKDLHPNFVVNCIGVLNQFAEENKPGAVLINSFFPHYVDSLCQEYAFKMVHISTDCVFSGSRGNYSEADFPDAASFYGRSKALGEVDSKSCVTFRTSIVGPDRNEKGIGLFNWFMKQENKAKGFSGVIWSGVTTFELAKAIEKSFHLDITGLYHLVNNQTVSKNELLFLFKKYTGKDIEIEQDDSCTSDKSLVNHRKDFDFSVPSYEIMVAEMCLWIRNHQEMYPNITLQGSQPSI